MFTPALQEQGPRNKCFKVTEVITDPDETRKIKALLSCISKKQLETIGDYIRIGQCHETGYLTYCLVQPVWVACGICNKIVYQRTKFLSEI